MNINSPLLRKFITLGRIDADTIKAKQQEFASTAELISKCGKIDSKDLAEQCIDLFRVPYFDLRDFSFSSLFLVSLFLYSFEKRGDIKYIV